MKKLLLIVMALAPAAAMAHEGDHSLLNLSAGFLHPLSGVDHLSALLATGLWLGQTDTRVKWALVAAFIAVLGLAIPVGMQFTHLTLETGIVATLVVLGVLLAAAVRGPLILRASVILATATVHGFVHGAELPIGEGVLPFSLGLATASLTVVVLSTAAGNSMRYIANGIATRLIGLLAIIAGIALSF